MWKKRIERRCLIPSFNKAMNNIANTNTCRCKVPYLPSRFAIIFAVVTSLDAPANKET